MSYLKKETPNFNHLALLCLTAALTLLGNTAIRLAALFISPVMVSMIRTLEIVMGLALEVTIQSIGMSEPGQELLDFTSKTFAFKVAGCAVVLLRCGHYLGYLITTRPGAISNLPIPITLEGIANDYPITSYFSRRII